PRAASPSSAVVPAAAQHPARLAAGELRQVALAHLLEGQAQVGGEVGDVPQHVAELLRQRLLLGLTEVVAGAVALVAHQLAELLGHLAGLAGELEGGVEHAGVLGRSEERRVGEAREWWLAR